MTVRVLSIDGGGMRGVIPAIWLAEIERRTQKRAAELFDLVAGTSTGGILALGLVKPDEHGKPQYSADDLLTLYQEHGQEIFHRSPWHRIYAIDNLLEEKWPAEGLEKTLAQYFGETRLSEALMPVMVTSYDIELRAPYFFKSYRASADPSRNFLMREAARGTSAAPTYFEPAKLPIPGSGTGDYVSVVDGGVFANNPAMCAYAEVKVEQDVFHDDDVMLVSLGTGELTRSIPYEEAKTWGLAKWAQPLLGVVFDGVSDAVGYVLDAVVPAGKYTRMQVTLTQGNDEMDDATRTNLHALERLAQQYIQQHTATFDSVCAALTA